MTTTRGFVALTSVMAIVCCAASAQAQAQGASAPEAAEQKKPFEMSAGLKLLAGGNLFSTPSDRPPGYEGIGLPATVAASAGARRSMARGACSSTSGSSWTSATTAPRCSAT